MIEPSVEQTTTALVYLATELDGPSRRALLGVARQLHRLQRDHDHPETKENDDHGDNDTGPA